MRYRVTHTTDYQYAAPVTRCYNQAWLLPATTRKQRTIRADLRISPAPESRS